MKSESVYVTGTPIPFHSWVIDRLQWHFFFHDTFPKLMFSGKTDRCYGVREEYSSAFFHRSFVLKLLLWGSYKDFCFFNVSALVFQLAAFSLAAFMMQIPADHRCWRILTPWIMPHNAVADNELVSATLAFIWSVSVFSRTATTKNLSERDSVITEADLKEQKPFPLSLFPLPRNALGFDFCQGKKNQEFASTFLRCRRVFDLRHCCRGLHHLTEVA